MGKNRNSLPSAYNLAATSMICSARFGKSSPCARSSAQSKCRYTITGTPDGVGVFRDPQVFLKSGDVIEIEIDMLGRLRNTVK